MEAKLENVTMNDNKRKKNLTVSVIGETNSGKSRLLFLIKSFLKVRGFEVEFEGDTDHPTEESLDTYASRFMRLSGASTPITSSRILDMSPEYISDTKITMKETQANRKITHKIDYKDKVYIEKRKILRQLSIKDEIRNFLDIITDDVAEYGFLNGLSGDQQRLINSVIDTRSNTFWSYIRNFLIDGYLAFEIIYEKSKPISIKSLDPNTLVTIITKDEPDSNGELPWCYAQYQDNEKMRRILNRDQVIYLSYSDANTFNTSYVEEIKESYERLKLVESSLFFTSPGQIMAPIESVQWLNKNLNKVSRIPESMLEFGRRSDSITYQRYINRIGGIFKNEIINRLLNLHKSAPKLIETLTIEEKLECQNKNIL